MVMHSAVRDANTLPCYFLVHNVITRNETRHSNVNAFVSRLKYDITYLKHTIAYLFSIIFMDIVGADV